jgi:hypothetical protein
MEENINDNKDALTKIKVPPTKLSVCLSFRNKGNCTRGDLCKFNHILSPKLTKLQIKKKKIDNDESTQNEEESINEAIKLSLLDIPDDSIVDNNNTKGINMNNNNNYLNNVEKKSKKGKKLDINNNNNNNNNNNIQELSQNNTDMNNINNSPVSLSVESKLDNKNITKGTNIPGMLLIPSNITKSLSPTATSFTPRNSNSNSFNPNGSAKSSSSKEFKPPTRNNKSGKNNNNNIKLVKDKTKLVNDSNNKYESCLICSDDKAMFMSVGECNHHICSICSLRLRYKSNSKYCTVCKQHLDYVIVYSSSLGTPSYNSFGITGITISY